MSKSNGSKFTFDFEQFTEDIYFAKYLKFKKYFDDSTYIQLKNIQDLSNKKIGEIAIEKKLLTQNIVDSIYDEGIRENKFFGQIALEKNILTVEQIEKIVEEQKNKFIGIGDLTTNFGYIRREKLEEELANFRSSQIKTNQTIDEKIASINFPNLRTILDTIIITLTRMLTIPPRLTTLIQPVTTIYSMDKLYRFTISKYFGVNFNIYFNFDEKFVNEIFLYKFRYYRNKKMLALRNSIPQEASNILTGVIVKNLAEQLKCDLNMSIPYPIEEQKIDLPDEHHKFAIASPTGKIEIIIETSKKPQI